MSRHLSLEREENDFSLAGRVRRLPKLVSDCLGVRCTKNDRSSGSGTANMKIVGINPHSGSFGRPLKAGHNFS